MRCHKQRRVTNYRPINRTGRVHTRGHYIHADLRSCVQAYQRQRQTESMTSDIGVSSSPFTHAHGKAITLQRWKDYRK